MAVTTRTFQAPKGTRDFYPADMAVRRWIESVWRDASIRHGFDEIDGPTYEHLDLYTVKSGPGIVSELFSFRRAGGDTDYALRPEFTPSLARMYAARANALPKPTQWFSICPFFRAERPQRGRLREHYQWNADLIGEEFPAGDARVLAVAVDVLERFGLSADQVQIKINHRAFLEQVLLDHGFEPARITDAINLVDGRLKVPEEEFRRRAIELGLDEGRWGAFSAVLAGSRPAGEGCTVEALAPLHEELDRRDLLAWCTYAPSLARGLAYYSGTVFEVHETTGTERAVAGGGRYDNLVELFGGPPTPAVGIAMGDVVIRLVLEDRGLLPPVDALMPRPDVFLVRAGPADADVAFDELLTTLRRGGYHVRHSFRATRNVGKLLGEAGRAGARCAVILGERTAEGLVTVKDLDRGVQSDDVPRGELPRHLDTILGKEKKA